MASTGSITVEIIVHGYPPNAGNLTFQESAILHVQNGDDTESYFQRVVAGMRNTLPGPVLAVGARDMGYDPARGLWHGTVVDHAAPENPDATLRAGHRGE